jgi:hypothetical protein
LSEIINNDNPLLDFPFFAENFLKIRSKSGEIKPLKLNRAQLYVHGLLEKQLTELGMVRAIILKGRQQGMSTMIGARFAHQVITRKGIKAFILTHETDATTNLFEITKHYIDNLPPKLCPKPDTSAANKLYFNAFKSGYAVGTAGNKTTGRSLTIQLLHASECGYWPNAEEHAKGVLNSVARAQGTEIIFESTANGIGNYFHSIWLSALKGESEYIPIFVPWYWQDDYRAPIRKRDWNDEEITLLQAYGEDGLTEEHLAWRRLKIGESGNDPEAGVNHFRSEYPFNWEESFRSAIQDVYINSTLVARARATKVTDCDDIALIIGVDPAIGDNDGTAIIRRRGRRCYKLDKWKNHNTMETVGRLCNIIDEEHPYKVYVDVIGIGAGIVDRMHERGYWMVEGINVSNRAAERSKFHNKRAELWSKAKRWLDGESPVELPDSDILHGELCNVGYKTDSSGRLQMESKEDIKGRGLPSPDCADSFCLTFSGGDMINIQSMMPSNNTLEQMRRDSSMFF